MEAPFDGLLTQANRITEAILVPVGEDPGNEIETEAWEPGFRSFTENLLLKQLRNGI